MQIEIVKKPSALFPVLMSLTALSLLAIQLATHGVTPERDEGAIAHLWQLLVVAQLPVIAFFAFRWLREAPRQATAVLLAQALALAAGVVPVLVLGW
jgi:hypothetical protein